MAQSAQGRIERAVIFVLAWLIVVFPTAWVAMLLTGALVDSRVPYWVWFLVCNVGMVAGEGLRWLGRRWRNRGRVNR